MWFIGVTNQKAQFVALMILIKQLEAKICHLLQLPLLVLPLTKMPASRDVAIFCGQQQQTNMHAHRVNVHGAAVGKISNRLCSKPYCL